MFLDDAPKDGTKGSLWKKILAYAIYFLFWLAFTASGLWLMLEIRALIVELMIVAGLSPWQVRGFDRWSIFVLGLGWFIALMWMEHYLRVAVERGRLWRNIAYLAASQAIVVAVIFAIRFLIRFS
ncbi:MAG: hypothetical protein IT328_01330 [Caldilineaceae bacterium]|nr:hypothetical protein [Caldilineaceae bacterium]